MVLVRNMGWWHIVTFPRTLDSDRATVGHHVIFSNIFEHFAYDSFDMTSMDHYADNIKYEEQEE
jgi:hypothetical protein